MYKFSCIQGKSQNVRGSVALGHVHLQEHVFWQLPYVATYIRKCNFCLISLNPSSVRMLMFRKALSYWPIFYHSRSVMSFLGSVYIFMYLQYWILCYSRCTSSAYVFQECLSPSVLDRGLGKLSYGEALWRAGNHPPGSTRAIHVVSSSIPFSCTEGFIWLSPRDYPKVQIRSMRRD